MGAGGDWKAWSRGERIAVRHGVQEGSRWQEGSIAEYGQGPVEFAAAAPDVKYVHGRDGRKDGRGHPARIRVRPQVMG